MDFLKFDAVKCTLCGKCIDKCPFGALSIEAKGIAVGDACRMCGMCVRSCPEGAIRFEQRANTVDKSKWRDFLVYVEQERGDIHPVAFELIGEARKMARKVGYKVNCVLVGGEGTAENAKKLLPYGVDTVYVYEHPGFEGFRADCCAAAKPSSVLIGATALGRSLAPRLSTRFHTGLTADCTTLDIEPSTDMVQIRPAFGGNIMAQIAIRRSRPQFATVRYRVMDRAERVQNPTGSVVKCAVTDDMARSRIRILSSEVIEKQRPSTRRISWSWRDAVCAVKRMLRCAAVWRRHSAASSRLPARWSRTASATRCTRSACPAARCVRGLSSPAAFRAPFSSPPA